MSPFYFKLTKTQSNLFFMLSLVIMRHSHSPRCPQHHNRCTTIASATTYHVTNQGSSGLVTTPANDLLISDVVCLSGTYLILLIRIRLYLCRLDYILSMFLLYLLFGISLLSFFIRTLIVLSLLFSLGTFLLFPNGLLSCITIDGLDLASRTFCRVQ